MTSTIATAAPGARPRSPFTGADVCRDAGLTLPDGTPRPVFDDDLWDFTDVVGLPVQMALYRRRFDFTTIADPRWRLIAKELSLALLAPNHDAVVRLPRAYRTPLHLTSCYNRLYEAGKFFGWLDQRGIATLAELDTHLCEEYLAFRRYVVDPDGVVVGEQSAGVRRAAAQMIVDLVDYRDLFSADRLPADLRPWGGATASAVAEMPSGRDGNKTPTVPAEVLQPMLAAALHLVQILGSHVVALNEQIRQIDRVWATKAPGLRHGTSAMVSDIKKLLADHRAANTPLPMLEEHDVNRRLTAGWDANDPLLPVSTGTLARQAGYVQFWAKWMPALRKPLINTLNTVGVEKIFGRNAAEAPTADGATLLPWTLPLHRSEAVALIGIARTAAIAVLAGASGMRASELMELRVGCRRVEEPIPGLKRYRVASKIIKGQGLGGTDDEWVVIEPVHRAIELIEQLHDDPRDGALLLSRFSFRVRYLWLRAWVNSPAGARLGLAPIPDEPVALRMLRRTVALEMAYRPGGVLAAKLHLKHIAAATTEGYAARPGGAQAELLAEVNKLEAGLLRHATLRAPAHRIRASPSAVAARWANPRSEDCTDRTPQQGGRQAQNQSCPSNATRVRPHTATAETRHSYAQRHADAGTPVDVLRELMGHRSVATTHGYYSVSAIRVRKAVDSLAAVQFNARGEHVWSQARVLLESEHQRLAVGQVAVPFGICTEPSNVQAGGGACPFRFRCLGCSHFRSDPSYLPELRDYLDTLLRDRERIRAATELDDWARTEAMPSDAEITRLRELIRRVEHDLDTLDENDRRQIEEAVRVVRATRQTVHLGLPTTRSPALDPNLEDPA